MQDLEQITLNYHDALDGFIALQPELDEVMQQIDSSDDPCAEDGHDADSLSDLFQCGIATLKALRRAAGRFRPCLERAGGTIEIAALSGNRGRTAVDIPWTYHIQRLCILCDQEFGFAGQALETALQTNNPMECVSHLRRIDRLRQILCMDLLGAYWCLDTSAAPKSRQAGDAEARHDPRADYIGAIGALRAIAERLRIWLDDSRGGNSAPGGGVPREYLSCCDALIQSMVSIQDQLARLYIDADAAMACLAADYGPLACEHFTPSLYEVLLNACATLDDASKRMRQTAFVVRRMIGDFEKRDDSFDDDSGENGDSIDDDSLDDDSWIDDDSFDDDSPDDENTLDISDLDLPDDCPKTPDEPSADTAPGGGHRRVSGSTSFLRRDYTDLLRELRDDLEATIRALDCRADS